MGQCNAAIIYQTGLEYILLCEAIIILPTFKVRSNLDKEFCLLTMFSSAFELSSQAELMWGVDGVHPFVRPTVNFGPDKSKRLDFEISFQGQ